MIRKIVATFAVLTALAGTSYIAKGSDTDPDTTDEHAHRANFLIKKTMSDSCIPDVHTVINPTADAVTALGATDGGACVAAAGWTSGTNFTNAYRSVRLGKQSRTCDSEVDVHSTAALQSGEDKIRKWVCSPTPCIAAGNQFLHCTGVIK